MLFDNRAGEKGRDDIFSFWFFCLVCIKRPLLPVANGFLLAVLLSSFFGASEGKVSDDVFSLAFFIVKIIIDHIPFFLLNFYRIEKDSKKVMPITIKALKEKN